MQIFRMARHSTIEFLFTTEMRRRQFIKAGMGAAAAAPLGWHIGNSQQEQATMRSAGASRNILVGSAVSNEQLHDEQTAQIVARQCGIVVPESEMDWKTIHPERTSYDFTKADELMNFAAKNSLKVRGRNLCWHQAPPLWLKEELSTENAADVLRQHIRTVAGRYAGRIHSWDVLNEAVDPGSERDDAMRDSIWMQLIGPEYIRLAFQTAAHADRRALLVYNESGLEGQGGGNDRKRDLTIGFLRWMRKNRIPIDAIGMQSHFRPYYGPFPDWVGLTAFIKEVRKLELQVFITELDIDDSAYPGDRAKQAKQAGEFCSDFLQHVLKFSHVSCVMSWGMVSYSTQIKDELGNFQHICLPYDEQLQPTPVLDAYVNTIRNR
jgi:endo-1,4-beta-xylanase